MKNLKKIVILGVIFLGTIIYIIYKSISNNGYEEIDFDESIKIEQKEETQEEKRNIVLHITGEVVTPGIIKIEEGSRVTDAIEAAGGVTENADLNKINLAYVLEDGQKLYIPGIYDTAENGLITENIGENIIEDFYVKLNSKININKATQTELETLTGIGPSTAIKIINFRKENGKFKSIEDIKNVPGIGESKFQAIKENICV